VDRRGLAGAVAGLRARDHAGERADDCRGRGVAERRRDAPRAYACARDRPGQGPDERPRPAFPHPGGPCLRPPAPSRRPLPLLHPAAMATSLCYAWLAMSCATIGAHAILPGRGLDFFGLLGIAAAALAWLVAYPRGWMQSPAHLAMHPGLLASLAIAGVAVGA